ncbi:hypothetical protein AURDEDRAFT_112994 [Auricularia subglabra TFB-10046 SS5]|nr:hypothetical protein AURDEDRAFT_112994 [Auricularia subglabra TFB-10046 SS5]
MAAHAAPLEYSCHCLNVTIVPAGEPQPAKDEPEFLTVRVADDAIAIAHPQLTLRDRSRPSEPTVQHVSLSCLVCNQLVYRVAHSIRPGDEARDGPVVPTAEWAEQEVLRSATGQIDVSRGCLSGEALRRARESDRFSDTFGILVTAAPPTPMRASAPPADPSLPPPPASQTATAAPAYAMNPLPTPALFAPPPFSPSHPAFAHLAKRAQARSEHLRHRAEAEIAALINARLLELDAADRALKSEVEAIWRAFREGWRAAVDRIPVATRSEDPLALVHANSTMSFDDRPALITRRPSLGRAYSVQSQQLPQVSLLSASLRQTGFRVPPHVPERAPGDDRSPSPPPYDDDSDDNDDDPSRPPRYDGFSASSLPAQIRRNMDPTLDISTSVRIESALAKQQQAADEQERRARKERRNRKKAQQEQERESVNVPRSSTSAAPAPPSVVVSPPRASAIKANGTPEKDKGKRKVVTFEEEPEVLVIQQPAPSPSPKPQLPPDDDRIEEMAMFELDGLDEAHPALPPSPAPVNGTAAHAPSRAVNGRAARTSALLASLSYRAPSTLSAGAAAISASAPPAPAPVETFKPYEEHLRRLVGADLPSHRDGWKKGGKAWKMFARGRRGRDGAMSDGDAEPADEDEDASTDDESPVQPQQGYASSLPIPIGPIASLARARRAPAPALEPVPEDTGAGAAAADTARQRARDILQRRADLPDAGMWRSLA